MAPQRRKRIRLFVPPQAFVDGNASLPGTAVNEWGKRMNEWLASAANQFVFSFRRRHSWTAPSRKTKIQLLACYLPDAILRSRQKTVDGER
jgi:hypothetical protein